MLMLDLIIIGAGPAGLAAAIYGKRAELDLAIVEKEAVQGGQIIITNEIDNYPGLPHTGGFELADKFREHAEALGATFTMGEVEKVETTDHVKAYLRDGTILEAKTAIIAGGAKHRNLNVPGEAELTGSGVSYCATCDGAFFRKKAVAVVGGGDVAIGDALFLARLCAKVYVIHRRQEFRAAKTLVTALKAMPNVEFVYDSTVKEIQGDGHVERVVVTNVKTSEESTLEINGIFVAVGMLPETSIYKDIVDLDEAGYIKADETGRTSNPMLFAAGDIRTKALRQVITAAADGANAITSVEAYLNNK